MPVRATQMRGKLSKSAFELFAQRGIKNVNLDEVAAHAQQISATARETTRALDEIVWAVNPANDTLEGLANYSGKYAQDYFALARISYRPELPTGLPAVALYPRSVKVFSPHAVSCAPKVDVEVDAGRDPDLGGATFLLLDRGATFLLLDRGATFLTRDRGATFLTRDRRATFLTRDRGATFLTRDRGATFPIGDHEGGMRPA